MARALYSGVGIAGMSGSINKNAGGTTFGKNGVVRRRVVPVNPQTADQQTLRAAFLYLTSAWSGVLSDSDRLAWETARTGNVYWLKLDPLTGVSRPFASAKDLFIAMNINGLYAQDSINAPSVQYTTPGTSAGTDVVSITSVVADDSSNTLVVTYTGGPPTLEAYMFKATPPVSPGTARSASIKSKLRNVALLTASPDTVADYQTKFGPLTGQTGNKIFYEIYGIDLATGKQRLISAGSTVIVA